MSYMNKQINLSSGQIAVHVFAPNMGQTKFHCPQCNRPLWSGYNANPDKEPIRRYECQWCEIGVIIVHYYKGEPEDNGYNKK